MERKKRWVMQELTGYTTKYLNKSEPVGEPDAIFLRDMFIYSQPKGVFCTNNK